MEQFVNSLLDNCNLPVLTAFLLGILTSVSPCTFTTNVMVLGYIGLGGSLDVFAGNVKRAPKLFQKLGLEWFYRLIKEPKRIGRMMKLPKFLFAAIGCKLRGKKHHGEG